MEQSDYINNLIASALAGEATPEQQHELELWKLAEPANMEYFRSMQRIMDIADAGKNNAEFDTDKAWVKLKQSIATGKSETKVIPILHRKIYSDVIRIAAMLLIFAGIGFAVYKILSTEKTPAVIVESGNEIREMALPDSTNIVLNRKSKITYAFSETKRVVDLKGEAYFDLAKDPSRPFEVNAGGVVIKDIGTAFNVKSIEGNDSLIVLVNEGEIQMSSAQGKTLVLTKGQTGIYIRSRDEFITQAIGDTNATAYRTKIFVFENATLSMVTDKISDVYGIKLIPSAAVAECHLTVTFKNENIDEIIDIISSTLHLDVKRESNSIILDGAGCNE